MDDDFISFLVGVALIGVALVAIYHLIIYIVLPGAAILTSLTAVGGAGYGGLTGIGNYFSSFKANTIDSNRGES